MHAPVLEVIDIGCRRVPLTVPHVPDRAPSVWSASQERLSPPPGSVVLSLSRTWQQPCNALTAAGEHGFLDRSTSGPHSLLFLHMDRDLLAAECWGPIHPKPWLS